MKVLYIAAECKPFSKVGGVGDVAGELPPALRDQGVHVEIATPAYASIDPGHIGGTAFSYDFTFNGTLEGVEVRRGNLEGIPVHFLKNATYFEGAYGKPYVDSPRIAYYDDSLRFSFFSYACLPLIARIKPDIVHINDWALGYLFGLMGRERM